MKNLDLNSYGVQKMNTVEMKETDGGWNDLQDVGAPRNVTVAKTNDGILKGLIGILAGLMYL